MADSEEQLGDVDVLEDHEIGDAVGAEYQEEQSTGSPHHTRVFSVQARSAVSLTAGFLGLCGFVAACIAGLAGGVPGVQVLLRAIAALFLCWFVGVLIGNAMRVLIEEHLGQHRDLHPRPEKPHELKAPSKHHRSAA